MNKVVLMTSPTQEWLERFHLESVYLRTNILQKVMQSSTVDLDRKGILTVKRTNMEYSNVFQKFEKPSEYSAKINTK